jgi:hypothetical protein
MQFVAKTLDPVVLSGKHSAAFNFLNSSSGIWINVGYQNDGFANLVWPSQFWCGKDNAFIQIFNFSLFSVSITVRALAAIYSGTIDDLGEPHIEQRELPPDLMRAAPFPQVTSAE